MKTIGDLLRSFLIDYLPVQRGMRPSTVKSYRDVLRLFLLFASKQANCQITKLQSDHFKVDCVLKFLAFLEEQRKNSVRTRNHRLAVLHCFCEYLASQVPEFVCEAQRIRGVHVKRCHPPETFFLEQDEVNQILKNISSATRKGRSCRDRVLIMFMYNTGARVQEVADLRVEHLDLSKLNVRLHGKGDKWRTCPLWPETVSSIQKMFDERPRQPSEPVFLSSTGKHLTRFGVYKIVRRHSQNIAKKRSDGSVKPISPHLVRHSTAIHLLESGVEINVIRGWLGHVSLETTNRYAEITTRMKIAALEVCQPPTSNLPCQKKARWRDDTDLLKWLDSL